jgi:nicotinate-nucleotide--dimethylbenzimidazole phosphoribosyltransferase
MSDAMAWFLAPPAPLCQESARRAEARQAQLLKPPGALGRLESLAIRLAAMQATPLPSLERVHIALFAGDHGVAEEGVSAFPQSVTAAMLPRFVEGGAAVNVLARALGARLEIFDMGVVRRDGPVPGVVEAWLGHGTANFVHAPAMSRAQLESALATGRRAAEGAREEGAQLFIGAEMGIANTTSATALAAALLGETPETLAGPGAGLDDAGLRRKIAVIQRALALHGDDLKTPEEILRRLGGFEIAALVGAYLACARIGLPALVDGFICAAAALLAERWRPGARTWFLHSHVSAEPGHRRLLQALAADPPLDLGLRLGEGSGAAVALPLLRLACALHRDMATFAEAGVAGKSA